jgi:hypothetical protein
MKITDKLILTPTFYEQSGQSFGALPEQNLLIYQQIHKWVYLFTVIYIVLKFLLVSLVVNTGFYLFKQNVSYQVVLKAVIIADFIFFIPAAFKIWYFAHVLSNEQLAEWIYYYPGSLLSFLNYKGTTWVYLLQVMNIFEVIYWFLIAGLLSKFLNLGFEANLRVVITSYLPALLFWSILVIFYTLMLSPNG